MNNYANKNVQKMKWYSPPIEGRRNYKGRLLDFNERTVPVSKKVLSALRKYLSGNTMQIYPEYDDLGKKISEYAGVRSDQVMITNGSDQGIDLMFRVFTVAGDKVIIPSPSFAMFYQASQASGNEILSIPYCTDLSFPIDKVLESICDGVKMIVICNPNNPTGTVCSLSDIERILAKALDVDAMVYVDEAYFEFCEITAALLINKYPNLLITRTFSKAFGLAALRIGYVLSSAKNIQEMLKVRGPYDICMPAVVGAKAALDDISSTVSYVDEVMNRAKPMVERFFTKNGVEFFSSKSNFILFKPKSVDAVFNSMKDSGFLMRPRSGVNIEGTLRVTIGTELQMKEFIKKYQLFNQ